MSKIKQMKLAIIKQHKDRAAMFRDEYRLGANGRCIHGTSFHEYEDPACAGCDFNMNPTQYAYYLAAWEIRHYETMLDLLMDSHIKIATVANLIKATKQEKQVRDTLENVRDLYNDLIAEWTNDK